MKRPETPKFLTDLYRDLRDRRLLIPAIGLVVAILAVPFLLAKGEEPVAPAATPAVPDGATEVSAAVLAKQSGIRDYRERLGALKQQNPFEQKVGPPAPESGGDDTGGNPAAASADTGTGSPASLPTGSAPTTDAGAATPASPTPPVTQPDPSSPAPDDVEPQDPPKPEIRFYVGRVDVAFGPTGDAKVLEGVRELDFIPGDKNPLAAFIGLAGNGDRAVFGITPSVVETRGDGSCAPKDGSCQFLRLAEGDVRYLKTESGKTFKLKLVETHLVRIPDPRDD